MRQYQQRKGNLYNPKNIFRISRSKIDLFMECPRCFYLDRKLGLARPDMPGWALNSAVDQLLKKEFDLLREKGQAHSLMDKYKIEAVPFKHESLGEWRDDNYKYKGASIIHKPTNFEVCGIIDDVWINKDKELIIVDYKSTSTQKEISLDDEYKQGYKRQMEVYQWIFRQLGFKVSDTGYFIFANADKGREKFDGKLEFEVTIIPYKGDDSWIEGILIDIKKCLDSDEIPSASENCQHCAYHGLIKNYE